MILFNIKDILLMQKRKVEIENVKDKNIAYIYLVITFCAWGSLYVVSKFVLGKIPVMTVLFLRYLVAGITLYVIGRSDRAKCKKIEHGDLKYVFIIGFVGYFLSVCAQFIGIKLSNASIASLINSMNPIAIMIFAAIILREKLTLKKIICVVLAVAGVYIIIGGVKGGQIVGMLFSAFGLVLWAFISVLVRRVTQKYSAMQLTTYCMFIAVICTMPFSIYDIAEARNVVFDWKVVLSILYMGIVCTALAYVLWNKSLSLIEAGVCSLFYAIQPLVSALLGFLLLGEKINSNFTVGAVLIISGVLFSIAEKRKTKE